MLPDSNRNVSGTARGGGDWGETTALMLARFGIEPRRLFALTVRQYNALCDYAARESNPDWRRSCLM